jgi:uncharacterized membrane protein YdjX (TVP38/TMEM64 family)
VGEENTETEHSVGRPIMSEMSIDATNSGDAVALDADAASAPAKAKGSLALRFLMLAAVLGGIYLVGHLTGVTQRFASVESTRDTIQAAGAWGFVLFVVVFCVGELVHIPGLVFVAAGVLVFGKLEGGLLSYVSALASVSFSFAVVRGVGGQALAEIERPLMKRILAGLDAHPILTVAGLRTVFIMSPPLNYALALSSLRYRDYLLGSIAGLIPPFLVAVLAFDWVIATFL